MKAFELLVKYGYGTRIDVTSDYKPLPAITSADKAVEQLVARSVIETGEK